MKRHAGFTLVELVMTMIVVGILAAMAVPRFFDSNIFQSRGFADQVQAALRYAQKAAIAQRRNVCATYTASPVGLALTITVSANCDTPLNLPTGNAHIDAPSGVTFSMVPATVIFNALGQPIALAAPAVATVDTTTITVEQETGYVH